jgi:hypothetical protein
MRFGTADRTRISFLAQGFIPELTGNLDRIPRVKVGQFIEYDPTKFKDRLLDIHRKAKRTKRL